MRTLTALLAAATCSAMILGGLLIAGCSSSTGPDEADGYLDPTSPENVLANLERAYEEMNVEEYLACMSEDFRFYFTEEDQSGYGLPPWLYRSDERQIHENMFDPEAGIEEITLELAVTEIETIPGLDPRSLRGDEVVYTMDIDLRVRFVGDMVWLAMDPQEFRFRAVEDGRDGETEWELLAWYDLEWGSAPADGREDAGWGGIKCCFLEYLTHAARRTTPSEVISQLETAYNEMDLETYMDCLGEGFVFYPNEEDVGGEIPEYWLRDTELTVHTHMFSEDPPMPGLAVESIQLTLTTVLVDSFPGPDPESVVYAYVEHVDLRVNLETGLTYLATAPSEFRLYVDADEAGPYGERMWEIVEWYDLLQENTAAAGSSRVEGASWASIKALYDVETARASRSAESWGSIKALFQ